MTDYQRNTFQQNTIIGYLFRSRHEDAARFIARDSENPAVPELFQYGKDDVMAFTGLAHLQKGETAILLKAASKNPAAASALFIFGHVHRGDIYGLALDSKNPAALDAVVQLAKIATGAQAFDYIRYGFLETPRSKSMNMRQIMAMNVAMKNLEMAEDAQAFYSTWLESAVLKSFKNEVGDGFRSRKTVEEFKEMFSDARALLGEDAGNGLIRKAFAHDSVGIIRQLVAGDRMTEERRHAFQAAAWEEARLAGMDDADIAAVITAEDILGRCLLDHVIRGGKNTLPSLVAVLEEAMGADAAKTWLTGFLGKSRGLMGRDVSYDLQAIRGKQHSKEDAEKIQSLCCQGSERADSGKLRQVILDIQPLVYAYLDANKADNDTARSKNLRLFADQCGPVTDGPTILAYTSGTALKFLLTLKERIEGLSKAELADALYNDMSMICDLENGRTSMHSGWACSTLLGPPGSVNAVREDLSAFILTLDDVFGTDVAVPLAACLFAIKDKDGETPLENTLSDGPEGEYARYYYPAMVTGLAQALGDDAKFTRYMDEAIVPNLPASFGGPAKKPNSAVSKYLRKGM